MFGTPKESKLEQLKQKSAGAIVVFKTTVQSLKSVNDEIVGELDSVEVELAKLKETKIALSAQAKENEGFVNKINEFLGIES